MERKILSKVVEFFENKKEKKNKEQSLNFTKLIKNDVDVAPLNEVNHTWIPDFLTPPCGCAAILVVDDQIINRMILNEFGKWHKLISDEAENGKIAFQKYKESQK